MEIGAVKKNSGQRIQVTLESYKGHELIDLRVYYLDSDNTWKPSPKGVAIPKRSIQEVIDLLQEAKSRMQE